MWVEAAVRGRRARAVPAQRELGELQLQETLKQFQPYGRKDAVVLLPVPPFTHWQESAA